MKLPKNILFHYNKIHFQSSTATTTAPKPPERKTSYSNPYASSTSATPASTPAAKPASTTAAKPAATPATSKPAPTPAAKPAPAPAPKAAATPVAAAASTTGIFFHSDVLLKIIKNSDDF